MAGVVGVGGCGLACRSRVLTGTRNRNKIGAVELDLPEFSR